MIFLKFLAGAIAIFIAGTKLTESAEFLAKKWGIAHHVMGFIFLSIITALPELCTSSTSAYISNVDLSLGNLFGSNNFNLFIIVILDFLNRGRPIVHQVDKALLHPARLGILLTSIAVFTIALSNGKFPFYLPFINRLKIFQVGLISIVIFLLYIWISRRIIKFSRKTQSISEDIKDENNSIKPHLQKFIIGALIIVGAGIYISHLADQISLIFFRGTVLGGTLVGTFLLALATSLPELAVTSSAVKKGFYSMALGNILGANLVNMQNIFWADIFYRPGTIFAAANSLHIFTGILAVTLTAMVIYGMVRPIRKTLFKLNLLTIIMLITYLGGFLFLYKTR